MNKTMTSLTSAPLGFGCASIMGKISRSQSLRALHLAHEHGIRHFDVARSYGFGRAESVLGEFLQGRRDQVTITTKFGVVPPHLGWKTRTLMPVARFVGEHVPGVASRLRKRSGEVLAQKRFDAAYAQTCLEQSLIELRTDHIDFYMLHEPSELSESQCHDLTTFMHKMVKAGKIRKWGMACPPLPDLKLVNVLKPDVVQMEGHLMNASAFLSLGMDPNEPRFVTRPFCGGLTETVHDEVERVRPGTLAEIQSQNLMLSDLAMAVSMKLAGPGGVVIGAMYDPNHIRRNSECVKQIKQNAHLMELADQWLKLTSHHKKT